MVTMMNFNEKLENIWERQNSLLCVGLDPDRDKIPNHLTSCEFPVYEFNKGIIDATHDLVCAYKPQIAYYSAYGYENQLEMTIDHIRIKYPDIPVILDAKRNDIGSTADMYAKEAFERYQADAVTVNPYMGSDTLMPFLKHKNKGIIVLCRTSNPGSGTFQELSVGKGKLYEAVAEKAVSEWNMNHNVLLVAGATNPDELSRIRKITGNMTILMPGLGAQGGDAEKAVSAGLNKQGKGLIINSSRGIIYAGSGQNYAKHARDAARDMRDEINRYRNT